MDLTRCVDLGDASNFLRSAGHQPAMVLHELAHGYHDQMLGWEREDVVVAFKKAEAQSECDLTGDRSSDASFIPSTYTIIWSGHHNPIALALVPRGRHVILASL